MCTSVNSFAQNQLSTVSASLRSADKQSAMASNTQHTFVTSITDEKLPGYKHHHDNIWPEVAAGLRAAGIASLKIYCMPSGAKGVNTLGEPENVNWPGRRQSRVLG